MHQAAIGQTHALLLADLRGVVVERLPQDIGKERHQYQGRERTERGQTPGPGPRQTQAPDRVLDENGLESVPKTGNRIEGSGMGGALAVPGLKARTLRLGDLARGQPGEPGDGLLLQALAELCVRFLWRHAVDW